MARRASNPPKTSSSVKNPVEQLQMLRAFVADAGKWTEPELMGCLRQCGYNVELAAERLITGQYKPTVPGKGKRSPYHSLGMSSSSSRQPSVAKVPPPAKLKPPPISTSSVTTVTKKSPSLPKVSPSDTSKSRSQQEERWLLCERWLSDAVCTTKNGRVAYKEKLQTEHSLTGHSMVRFRGENIEGRLPETISCMLGPLLRLGDDESIDGLISMEAEALMEERGLCIGALLPLSLTVYITNPRGFFELFNKEATTTNIFFASKQRKRSKLPVQEAAFSLLQWAQYGDVPDFKAPDKDTSAQTVVVEEEGHQNEEEAADIEMNEDEFEAASVAGSTAEGKEMDEFVTTSSDWTTLLPEADDPKGFTDGIVLRPYQKQALYWMYKREKFGDSREELDAQLQLMCELSESSRKSQSINSIFSGSRGSDIVCDCGPVIVAETAQCKAKTVDGETNPVSHPLWQRRFMCSPDKSKIITFFVNELMEAASHQPPAPPTPCSGGLLCDSMGLGKTVMLMALILKSKQERVQEENGNTIVIDQDEEPSRIATLVVAKLSLLPQWEDELKSKTNLTYYIYYGQQGSKCPTVEELEGVDVVVTTYGTIQGDLTRKNPILLKCKWLRVVLDEAHCIRNQKTLASKVCCNLDAKHRWCVSGTIIQNSLEDVYGMMKFLRHEPWCIPSFWKSAVTRPFCNSTEVLNPENETSALQIALDRVRRLLAPMMLRRTKDSVTKDGKPILTLPPVETKIVRLELTETEREFYNAVYSKSIDVFQGFVDSGVAAKSYVQIFSMLSRLRQVCNHIALTVRTRIDGEDLLPIAEAQRPDVQAMDENMDNGMTSDALGARFMESLLAKFSAKSRKRTSSTDIGESPTKRLKDDNYLAEVANMLSAAVQQNSTYLENECPICLEHPKIDIAVVTPCAHIFCRDCLVGYLREKNPSSVELKNVGAMLKCPDGECPCCNKTMDASRIIGLVADINGEMRAEYLIDMKSSATLAAQQQVRETGEGNPQALARQILEDAMGGYESSKMKAVLNELYNVWEVDLCAKVLVFSHYLGFLDLLQQQFQKRRILTFRLDGTLSLKERMSVLEQFRSANPSSAFSKDSQPEGAVLLMTMGAGAEGLNLTTASACFICDPWWNAAKEEQCVNRIHRIGQTASAVRVRKFLVTDTVEERIVELQRQKKFVASELYNDVGRTVECGTTKLGIEDFKLIFGK